MTTTTMSDAYTFNTGGTIELRTSWQIFKDETIEIAIWRRLFTKKAQVEKSRDTALQYRQNC